MNWFSRIVLSSRTHARARIGLVDALLRVEEPLRGGDALEIGCGAGFVSAHLADKYAMRVVATDASPDMLEIARKKNGADDRLSFSVADAMALPFEDASFDLIVAQNVLHHVPDWKTAADEIARVLRPEGLFLFSDIAGPSAAMRIFSGAGKSHGFHEVDGLVSRMAGRSLEVIRKDEPVGGRKKELTLLFRKSAE